MGAVGMLLLVAALALPGAPPQTDDSVAQLKELLLDKRELFLVGIFIGGLGSLALLWFLGSLREVFGTDATSRVAVARACSGGVVGIVLLLAGLAIVSGVALGSESRSNPALVRASIDVSNVLIGLSRFGFAMLILGVASAAGHTALLSARMRTLGTLAALLVVLSALPPLVADRGIWQYGGFADIACGAPATLWLIGLSFVMLTRLSRPRPGTEEPSSP
jgi:hypothetical protein